MGLADAEGIPAIPAGAGLADAEGMPAIPSVAPGIGLADGGGIPIGLPDAGPPGFGVAEGLASGAFGCWSAF